MRGTEGDSVSVSGMAVTLNMCVICNVWWLVLDHIEEARGGRGDDRGREGDCMPKADLRNRQLPSHWKLGKKKEAKLYTYLPSPFKTFLGHKLNGPVRVGLNNLPPLFIHT